MRYGQRFLINYKYKYESTQDENKLELFVMLNPPLSADIRCFYNVPASHSQLYDTYENTVIPSCLVRT